MKTRALTLAMLMACCCVTSAYAAWDETIDGDLSNNGLAPSAITVNAGSNVIVGSVGNAGAGIDRDYFRITVPNGSSLTSIKLLSNTSVSGSASFIAVQAGPQVTVTTGGGGVEHLLGFAHYGNDLIGTDLLPSLVFSNFSGSLPSGTYSVWVQETGGTVAYGLDFVITPSDSLADAPLPLWAELLLAMALLGVMFNAQRLRT